MLAALWLGRGRSLLLVIGGVGFCLPITGTAMTDLGSAGEPTTVQWVGALAATGGIYLCALAIPVLTLRLIRLGLGSPPAAEVSGSYTNRQTCRGPADPTLGRRAEAPNLPVRPRARPR